MSERIGPLTGIRVLDLTHVMSGPYATAMLADLGADVIKIEPPDRGDLSRSFAPFIGEESAYFLMLNRGKQSVTVDLKHDDGRRIVGELAAKSDVVVENFRPGVADRLGVGYHQVQAANPSIIYASITGFGADGPLADAPAFDLVVQAMSGLMSVTGPADGPASAMGESIADVVTGMFCASAILAALVDRERSGVGSHLDIAMLDSVFATLITPLSRLLYTDEQPRRVGNRHPETYPVDSFATIDGEIVLVVPADAMLPALSKAIGTPLHEDPRFTTNDLRNQHETELRRIITDWAGSLTSEAALALLTDNGIPCGPIRDLHTVVNDSHTVRRGLVGHGLHPSLGEVPLVEQPVKVHRNGEPGQSVKAPHRLPTLGGDTDAVLQRVLGLGANEIDKLRADGVVGRHSQSTTRDMEA